MSLEEHLRVALKEDVTEDRRRLVAEWDKLRAEIEKATGILPDSTPLIREAREEMERKSDRSSGRLRRGEEARSRRKTA